MTSACNTFFGNHSWEKWEMVNGKPTVIEIDGGEFYNSQQGQQRECKTCGVVEIEWLQSWEICTKEELTE